MHNYLTNLSRATKGAILLYADMVLIALSCVAAIQLALNELWPVQAFIDSVPVVAVLLISAVVLTKIFRLHLTKLGGYETKAILKVSVWVIVLTAIAGIANVALSVTVPLTTSILFGLILGMSIFTTRFSAIAFLRWLEDHSLKRIPVAVYGAGAGGLQLIAALKSSRLYRPVLFVDDNQNLQNLEIAGLQVHAPSSLADHLAEGRIEKVFLAIPSISPAKRRQKLATLQDLDCEVLELPSYIEMIRSGGMLRSLRPIDPEDLLGRAGVDLGIPEVEKTYAGKNVFVSGAGGSIGSELCRMLLETAPNKIVLFEMSEYSLYAIDLELRQAAGKRGIELVPVLGTINNQHQLETIFKTHAIEVIVHAAAYKHVPLVEANELEGIRNNVMGTKALADAAVSCGVERFTMISTDKAVRPTNVMGATKRLGELIVQNLADEEHSTIFSIVRFGNVLGSSGSVIPLFKRQIENGGPVTLTHEDVTRYFMTIPEAARLVLLAGCYAEGGDVFVLDMGKPVRIHDLAVQMIEHSGNTIRTAENSDGDIEIRLTGLRPGEKLYEELLIGEDNLPTPHPKILRARESKLSGDELGVVLLRLTKGLVTEDVDLVRFTLGEWVEGYQAPDQEPASREQSAA